MAFLTPDRIRIEHGLEIKEKIIPDGSRLKPNRKLSRGTGKARYITIHNTSDINEADGTSDAEQYARATLNGNMRGVSVHYYIDESECWQTLGEDEVGYHAADGKYGPGNDTSIAIEIIMDGSGRGYDRDAEERGACLAAILLDRHSLGLDALTTHNRWYPKKYCPAYILPNWEDFVGKVRRYLDEIERAKTESEPPAEDGALYKVQIGTFKKRENALALAEKAKKAGFDAFVSVDGDLNGDGKITAADARETLRRAVGLGGE